jgi:hypothetical protein
MEFTFTLETDKYNKTVISFYDAEYKNDPRFTIGKGQFVTSYYVSTLTRDKDSLCQYGLNLDAGIPEWSLTGKQMTEVFNTIDKKEYSL